MKSSIALGLTLLLVSQAARAEQTTSPYLLVLGIAQDAGYPQAGCRKACCQRAWAEPSVQRRPVALAIVDPAANQRWLVECTPGFVEQLHLLDQAAPPAEGKRTPALDGVLLTHAHIGHYAGLIHLGREVIGASGTPVYVMPRMRTFLEQNGPWSQLVKLDNIALRDLKADEPVELNDRIRVTPLLVPHREEFSETVGFRIEGPERSALFLPDIDKWDHWPRPIEEEIAKVDAAYLDGTFYDGAELPGRDMSEIPHPFIVESIKRFAPLPESERGKVRFVHFNHTNPALDPNSPQAAAVRKAGHHVAEEGDRFAL